jgi:hypothetical protein
VVPGVDDDNDNADNEETSPRPGSTWSFSGDDEGEDLPPTLSPTIEDAPRMESPVTQGMSGLSLTAPRDSAGQLRRSPPPPPPSKSVSATPRTDAFFATTASTLQPPISNAGIDPIPDRQPAAVDIPITRQRSSSQSGMDQAFSPPDSSLVQATSPDAPLGPGVSKDAELTEEGMVSREVDGQVITVPADEIVRGVEDAMERHGE